MAMQHVIVGVLLAAFVPLRNCCLIENVLRYPSVQVRIPIVRSGISEVFKLYNGISVI